MIGHTTGLSCCRRFEETGARSLAVLGVRLTSTDSSAESILSFHVVVWYRSVVEGFPLEEQ